MRLSIRSSAVVLAAAVASAVASVAAAATFATVPLYDVYYFSDASHTVEVGYQIGFCDWNNPARLGPVQGSSTAYSVTVQVGVCRDGAAEYW